MSEPDTEEGDQMLARLARWCYRKRKLVLPMWIVGLVAMSVLGGAFAGPFATDFDTPGTESKRAHELLSERFPERAGDSVNVIFEAEGGINAPGVAERLDAFVEDLSTNEHVIDAITPYEPEGANQVSRSNPNIAFASLQLDLQATDFPIDEAKEMIAKAADATGNGVTFELGGFAIANAEFEEGSSSEAVGVLAAIVILLISFGSLLAMGLPILTAVMGIGIGLAIVSLLAHIVDVPNFTSIVAGMIGLGVGIDYALFIVTRYRQGLHEGMDPERATIVAISTAGRAVLFAGTTVVISVLGMLLMNLPFLQGVAVGSASVVLVTMLGSVTLLPAMLGFVGRKIDSLKVPFIKNDEGDHRSGFWFRWSRLVQRRPWPAFLAGSVAIILLALPIFSLRVGFPGDESSPTERTSRRAYDLFVKGFGPGFSAPLILAAEFPVGKGETTLSRLQGRLSTEEGVAAVTPAQPNLAGDTAVLTVFPEYAGTDVRTEKLVSHLRNDLIPSALAGTDVKVSIGGPNASFVDQSRSISKRLPIFIAVVVGLSFLLLMAVFRSVLVAVKAAIMNLLSIGAAYGVLVAVAQWGWMKDLFGITTTGPIANFIPMMMFAILFGLSMDYEVFLLSRVREEYVKTGDNGLAVADGLAATARVITAAAAVMIMVFLSFVLGPELVIKQIGLGLAVAILIDATLVRMVLVPSTMELLGKANWWLPGWLDRALPNVGFEGTDHHDLDAELEELTSKAGSA